jgi:hypothetical protein
MSKQEKTKFWKTTIVFEVLTEDPTSPLPDDMSLSDIIHMTIHGHASGDVKSLESDEVTHEEMKELLRAQNSDPEFLNPEAWSWSDEMLSDYERYQDEE